jgi:glyoxylase-like metal-dependent hydrolase (beta-lactamase superfamily II)
MATGGILMLIRRLNVGYLDTNCYLVACRKTSETVVIDPGFKEDETGRILEEIDRLGLQVKYIVNTHGHIDHISGNGVLKQAFGAEILIHKNDAPMLLDSRKNLSRTLGVRFVSTPEWRLLSDEDLVEFGRLELRVIHTPGHTKGSISLYSESERVAFTGDTLFAGSIGRTDLLGSSFKDIMRSLKKRLMKLPDQTVAYPGHGEKTTIGKEKLQNPFILT